MKAAMKAKRFQTGTEVFEHYAPKSSAIVRSAEKGRDPFEELANRLVKSASTKLAQGKPK